MKEDDERIQKKRAALRGVTIPRITVNHSITGRKTNEEDASDSADEVARVIRLGSKGHRRNVAPTHKPVCYL